jgi:mannose-6-phosphate isomerase-like protein (cupin superfamily)
MHERWSAGDMAAQRLVRYRDLRPCLNAFVDTYTPGSDRKENFTIIGPGVAEHPGQHVHIAQPHGFNIGGARQPPGCTNSQHSHMTEEVFIVHSGSWAFRWGDRCQDGEAVLGPGDCISIPVNVFRGFENVGNDEGYLFAVLGGDDPGNVLWAPDVFDKATDYGLVLLEDGRLVDTTQGETVPEGVAPMPRTSDAQIAAHRVMSVDEMLDCVCDFDEQSRSTESALTRHVPGVRELPLIGGSNPDEDIAAGKLAWAHGFHLRRLEFAPGASLALHARLEEEVLYLHRGRLAFDWADGTLELDQGDVLTVPVGLEHAYRNASTEDATAYVVRGGDSPAAPQWHLPEDRPAIGSAAG